MNIENFVDSQLVSKINEYFYEGLERQSSVFLYGSAATGNWVPGRSDLDIIVLIHKEKSELLGRKIRMWASMSELPILDGYALISDKHGIIAKRLDDFERVTFPPDTNIVLIDQWNIRNKSKHLFGNDSIDKLFPDICLGQLSQWASEELKLISESNPEGAVPEVKFVFSKLVWSVSWFARMLMLSRGIICESKYEALQWLASEFVEIKSLVLLLLDDYSKSDTEIVSITYAQSLVLRKFCLGILKH